MAKYYPIEENGKFYAEKEFINRITEKKDTIKFKDWNQENLEFVSFEEAQEWCNTRNEIEEIV